MAKSTLCISPSSFPFVGPYTWFTFARVRRYTVYVDTQVERGMKLKIKMRADVMMLLIEIIFKLKFCEMLKF